MKHQSRVHIPSFSRGTRQLTLGFAFALALAIALVLTFHPLHCLHCNAQLLSVMNCRVEVSEKFNSFSNVEIGSAGNSEHQAVATFFGGTTRSSIHYGHAFEAEYGWNVTVRFKPVSTQAAEQDESVEQENDLDSLLLVTDEVVVDREINGGEDAEDIARTPKFVSMSSGDHDGDGLDDVFLVVHRATSYDESPDLQLNRITPQLVVLYGRSSPGHWPEKLNVSDVDLDSLNEVDKEEEGEGTGAVGFQLVERLESTNQFEIVVNLGDLNGDGTDEIGALANRFTCLDGGDYGGYCDSNDVFYIVWGSSIRRNATFYTPDFTGTEECERASPNLEVDGIKLTQVMWYKTVELNDLEYFSSVVPIHIHHVGASDVDGNGQNDVIVIAYVFWEQHDNIDFNDMTTDALEAIDPVVTILFSSGPNGGDDWPNEIYLRKHTATPNFAKSFTILREFFHFERAEAIDPGVQTLPLVTGFDLDGDGRQDWALGRIIMFGAPNTEFPDTIDKHALRDGYGIELFNNGFHVSVVKNMGDIDSDGFDDLLVRVNSGFNPATQLTEYRLMYGAPRLKLSKTGTMDVRQRTGRFSMPVRSLLGAGQDMRHAVRNCAFRTGQAVAPKSEANPVAIIEGRAILPENFPSWDSTMLLMDGIDCIIDPVIIEALLALIPPALIWVIVLILALVYPKMRKAVKKNPEQLITMTIGVFDLSSDGVYVFTAYFADPVLFVFAVMLFFAPGLIFTALTMEVKMLAKEWVRLVFKNPGNWNILVQLLFRIPWTLLVGGGLLVTFLVLPWFSSFIINPLKLAGNRLAIGLVNGKVYMGMPQRAIVFAAVWWIFGVLLTMSSSEDGVNPIGALSVLFAFPITVYAVALYRVFSTFRKVQLTPSKAASNESASSPQEWEVPSPLATATVATVVVNGEEKPAIKAEKEEEEEEDDDGDEDEYSKPKKDENARGNEDEGDEEDGERDRKKTNGKQLDASEFHANSESKPESKAKAQAKPKSKAKAKAKSKAKAKAKAKAPLMLHQGSVLIQEKIPTHIRQRLKNRAMIAEIFFEAVPELIITVLNVNIVQSFTTSFFLTLVGSILAIFWICVPWIAVLMYERSFSKAMQVNWHSFAFRKIKEAVSRCRR